MARIVTILMVLVLAGAARGQDNYGFEFSKAGTGGFQFLKIGMGARESAMGEAVAGVSQDANAVFWNQAGLPFVESYQAAFTHNAWIAGSRVDALVGVFPALSFVIGVHVMQLAIEEFEETTVDAPDGTGRMVDAGDLNVGLTVSRRFSDRFTLGVQAKYVREELDGLSVNNLLFDVGAMYYVGFHRLRLAFVVQHFGPDRSYITEKFRMPLLFRVGAADEFAELEGLRATAAVDLVHPTDNDEWLNAWAELTLMNVLSVRAGYRFLHEDGKFSFGGGFSGAGVLPVDVRVDYAYASFGEALGATHRISLIVGF